MGRYDYECGSCGAQTEHICSMSARPASLPCECGGEAKQVILSVPESFVKYRPYEFRKDKVVAHNGKKYGRTVDQQHKHYEEHFGQIRKNIARSNRSRSKNAYDAGGFRYLGGMPGEMADSIAAQEGTKQAVSIDPDYWFRKTGMYVGEGDGK